MAQRRRATTTEKDEAPEPVVPDDPQAEVLVSDKDAETLAVQEAQEKAAAEGGAELDKKTAKEVAKVDERIADPEDELNLPYMVAAGNGMSIEYGGQGNPGYVHCETCGPVGKAADVATGKLIADAHFAQVHPAAP